MSGPREFGLFKTIINGKEHLSAVANARGGSFYVREVLPDEVTLKRELVEEILHVIYCADQLEFYDGIQYQEYKKREGWVINKLREVLK